jgi:hypothetical protein
MTNTETFRPTILDILSTMDVTSEILTLRADYFETVAARSARRGRDVKSARIFANVEAMRREARRLAKLEKVEPFTTDRTRAALASALVGKAAAKAAKPAPTVVAPVKAAAKPAAKPAAKSAAKPAAKPAKAQPERKSFATFRAMIAARKAA